MRRIVRHASPSEALISEDDEEDAGNHDCDGEPDEKCRQRARRRGHGRPHAAAAALGAGALYDHRRVLGKHRLGGRIIALAPGLYLQRGWRQRDLFCGRERRRRLALGLDRRHVDDGGWWRRELLDDRRGLGLGGRRDRIRSLPWRIVGRREAVELIEQGLLAPDEIDEANIGCRLIGEHQRLVAGHWRGSRCLVLDFRAR